MAGLPITELDSESGFLDVSYVVPVKSTVEISQNFVASEYMNFKVENISKGSQQCFALLPQVNFPANNLNFY